MGHTLYAYGLDNGNYEFIDYINESVLVIMMDAREIEFGDMVKCCFFYILEYCLIY